MQYSYGLCYVQIVSILTKEFTFWLKVFLPAALTQLGIMVGYEVVQITDINPFPLLTKGLRYVLPSYGPATDVLT